MAKARKMIYVGNLHKCGEDDPKKNDDYFVFSLDANTKRVEHIQTYSFVVGHGWNTHVNYDGTVSDNHAIVLNDEDDKRRGTVYYWMEGEIYARHH